MFIEGDSKLTITMPCFNEGEGIFLFLCQIENHFRDLNAKYVVVNDCSTDDTSEQLESAKNRFPNLIILSNSENVGHGPSTLAGIHYALSIKSTFVITIDGDGQFKSNELRSSFDKFLHSQAEILEGVRQGRSDPFFRKIVTFCLRILVFIKTQKLPRDANTPFRIYRTGTLKVLLREINPNSMVPNIEISILSRRLNLKILEENVCSRTRLGKNKTGTTWKSRRDYLPSARFIRFCISAVRQVVRC